MSETGEERLRRLAEASENEARQREQAVTQVPASRSYPSWLPLVAACALLAVTVLAQGWHGQREAMRLAAAEVEASRLADDLARAGLAQGPAARDQGTLATLQPALVPSARPGEPPRFRLASSP